MDGAAPPRTVTDIDFCTVQEQLYNVHVLDRRSACSTYRIKSDMFHVIYWSIRCGLLKRNGDSVRNNNVYH